jgi:hypothetical protein
LKPQGAAEIALVLAILDWVPAILIWMDQLLKDGEAWGVVHKKATRCMCNGWPVDASV